MTLGTGIALAAVWAGLSAISYSAKDCGSAVFHLAIALCGVGVTLAFQFI